MLRQLAILAALLAPVSAAAQDGIDALAPLRPLAGNCYAATFPDGESVDTHCWSAMLGGHFIRDVHAVTDGDGVYEGETIYEGDPQGEVSFRYWNSIGGVSGGAMVAGEGALHFPGETYVGDDGEVLEMRGVMRDITPEGYVAYSEILTGDDWQPLWTMHFERVDDR